MFRKISFVLLLLSAVIVSSTGSPYSDPHFVGNRTVIVHLMEWKYSEIAKECELFLGPYGYGGVQLSPAGEHMVGERREWSDRYAPVSYKLVTRSGNEKDLADMVDRCNRAGVRIYVDVVLNHMTGGGKGVGTDGSAYDGIAMTYDGVKYSHLDFHGHESCPTADLDVHDVDNPIESRNCRLGGLRDLDQGREWVRQKQSDFLNRLIDIGVAGFRFDASKHQWPSDLQNITSRLHNLKTKYFPLNTKPFIYHEVITNATNRIKASEYTGIGRVIEFNAYQKLAQVIRKQVINGRQQRLSYLKTWGEGWALLKSNDAFVMVDSHDLQRGHNGEFTTNIDYFEPKLLKMATAFMLSWPYAVTRVMSSYSWPRNIVKDSNNMLKDTNDWVGPPHDSHFNIIDVKRNADLSCGKEWICEHRWREIYSMVEFRNIAGTEVMTNWWTNGFHSIAFSRGNKAFIAINNDIQPINETLKTGLPAGRYCDIINGSLFDGKCSGKEIKVESDGRALIYVDNKWEDPMIAIHIQSKLK